VPACYLNRPGNWEDNQNSIFYLNKEVPVKRVLALLLSITLLAAAAACSSPKAAVSEEATALPTATQTMAATAEPSPAPTEEPAPFCVTSSGIVDGVIGDAYGTRAEQKEHGIPSRSLPLAFTGIPSGTMFLALSMIGPDGGDWVHWLAVNLAVSDLTENASIDLAEKMIQGKNDFGFTGYGGPTPPSGTHTYIITVYALSESVSLDNGFSLEEFGQAIDGKVLATAELQGDYSH